MSDKSKKLNKEFDGKILAKAKKIINKYEVIMSFEDNQWYGRGLEMPLVFGDGKTPDECIASTKEALTATVAHLLEIGEPVPAPATEGKRTEQVNVRLTAEEKTIIGTIARSQGFKGIGDYLRAKALSPSLK
ncbi:MAG: type II toxin-antitoxin system HicB family antitoxin [Planctomycetes bacterium]|nr:type II toxin-antitoxin system HicB family antitoxin [Planctomycetota bacterium]